MTSRRLLKAAEAIREVVSMAILTELRDPRIEGVTVTHVEVMPDMRSAKVHVSIMGSEVKQQRCLVGLQRAAGFLQQCVSDRIDTRYTPRLQFEIDQGVKKSIEVSRLLRELLPPAPDASAAPADAAAIASGEFPVVEQEPSEDEASGGEPQEGDESEESAEE